MNPKSAKENFQKVKNKILEDGKIDGDEIKILLSFLEPYTKKYSVKFSTLRDLLYAAEKTGRIEENQTDLIKALEEAEDFLRTEYMLERTIGYLIAFVLTFIAFYFLLP